MNNYEICNYMSVLCKMINKNLNEIVNENCNDLPFFIMFNANACYVRYDTQEENITHVILEVMNRDGLAVEIDPIKGIITGVVADDPSCVVEMNKDVASILFSCISVCWKKRLQEEGIISFNVDDRVIAADLLG